MSNNSSRKNIFIAIVVALVIIGIQSCSVYNKSAIISEIEESKEGGFMIKGVPFISQQKYYCGPASLAMVLNFWGGKFNQDEIAKELYIEELKGTLNFDLEFYSRHKGYRAKSARGTLEELKALILQGKPVIILEDLGMGPIKKWHYSVVVGYNNNRKVIISHSGVEDYHITEYSSLLDTWGKSNKWMLIIEK